MSKRDDEALPGRPLTLRQARFVAELLHDFNATQAAIRAGYSEKTAYSIANELLGYPHVKLAVATAIEERSTRTKITTDWVVVELRELYAKALRDGDSAVAARCLEQLGKHTGGFSDRLELSGALTLDVAGARERIAAKAVRHTAAKPKP